jgi:hypothetical protein
MSLRHCPAEEVAALGCHGQRNQLVVAMENSVAVDGRSQERRSVLAQRVAWTVSSHDSRTTSHSNSSTHIFNSISLELRFSKENIEDM